MKRRQDDLEAVRAAIANGGAMTIYDTLMSISSDPKSPAQARVSACATIVRMSGLFEEAKRKPADDEEGVSFTAEQYARLVPMLEQEAARLEADLAERRARREADDDGDEDEHEVEEGPTDVFA